MIIKNNLLDNDKIVNLENLKNKQNMIIEILEKNNNFLKKKKLNKSIFEIKNCFNYFKFRHDPLSNKFRKYDTRFCKNHYICPVCAKRRNHIKGYELNKKISALLETEKSLKVSFLTLTVKNEFKLESALKNIQNYKSKLIHCSRSKKYEFNKVLGCVGGIEFTKKEKGWHGHIHMILLHSTELDKNKLSRDWRSISGSAHIDLKNVNHQEDQKKYIKNICFYISKPVSLKGNDIDVEELKLRIEFQNICRTKKARLLFSTGLLRGLNQEPNYEELSLDEKFYEGIAIYENGRFSYKMAA